MHVTIYVHAHAMVYPEIVNSESELVWEALHRVHAKLDLIIEREVKTATGLSMALLDALRVLDQTVSHFTMAELADRVLLSRTRVSRVVDELVGAGLVARESNPDDGRSSFVTLTKEGRQKVEKALPVYKAAVNREIKKLLSPQQLRQLADSLDKAQ